MAYAENQITLEVVSDGAPGAPGAPGEPGAPGADGRMLYATCQTAADTAAKVATLSAGTLTLETGATVAVTFANPNTANNATLNVSGTGAKGIIAIGDALTEESGCNWIEDSTVIFVYDGTSWQMDGTSSLNKAEQAKQVADTATINITDLDLFINGGYATEVTSRFDENELTCDKTLFYDAVSGVYGDYEFTYDGSDWKLNGTAVDIAAYGLTLAAAPVANDTINVNLVEVIGSMSDINEKVADLRDVVDENAETAASDMNALRSDLEGAIEANAEAIANAQDALDIVETKTAGMGFTNEYGLVLYGQNATDSAGFKLQLAAQAINFINGSLGSSSDILAYISGNALYINNATVRKQLKFGNFAFIPRSNGSMSLKYLG